MTLHGINLQSLALLSGASAVIAPYVAAFVTRNHFRPVVNSIIVWLVCAVMGAASYLSSGGSLDAVNTVPALLGAVSAVFVGAKQFYFKIGYKDPFLVWLKNIGAGVNPPAQEPAAVTPAAAPSAISATNPAAISTAAPIEIGFDDMPAMTEPAPEATETEPPREVTIRADAPLTKAEIDAGHAALIAASPSTTEGREGD